MHRSPASYPPFNIVIHRSIHRPVHRSLALLFTTSLFTTGTVKMTARQTGSPRLRPTDAVRAPGRYQACGPADAREIRPGPIADRRTLPRARPQTLLAD